MLDFDWLLLEWVNGSKIGEKTLRVMLSCRHKLIKLMFGRSSTLGVLS